MKNEIKIRVQRHALYSFTMKIEFVKFQMSTNQLNFFQRKYFEDVIDLVCGFFFEIIQFMNICCIKYVNKEFPV